jgi:hypothetical protein
MSLFTYGRLVFFVRRLLLCSLDGCLFVDPNTVACSSVGNQRVFIILASSNHQLTLSCYVLLAHRIDRVSNEQRRVTSLNTSRGGNFERRCFTASRCLKWQRRECLLGDLLRATELSRYGTSKHIN